PLFSLPGRSPPRHFTAAEKGARGRVATFSATIGPRTVTRTFEAFPEQAAAFPVRRFGRDIQVCLIRRKTTGVWGIPKGIVDPGDTHEETALNEAWEEAGISGRLLGKAGGAHPKKKGGKKLNVARYGRGGF